MHIRPLPDGLAWRSETIAYAGLSPCCTNMCLRATPGVLFPGPPPSSSITRTRKLGTATSKQAAKHGGIAGPSCDYEHESLVTVGSVLSNRRRRMWHARREAWNLDRPFATIHITFPDVGPQASERTAAPRPPRWQMVHSMAQQYEGSSTPQLEASSRPKLGHPWSVVGCNSVLTSNKVVSGHHRGRTAGGWRTMQLSQAPPQMGPEGLFHILAAAVRGLR